MFLLASLGVQYWAHSRYENSGPTLNVEEGMAAPAWSLADVDGNRVSSQDFRGRILILDFWATWCGPCRSEFNMLRAWWKNGEETGLLNGVELVAVNLGEPLALVNRFIENRDLPFRFVLDSDGAVAGAFGVTSLPSLIVIDPDGRVAYTSIGYHAAIGVNLSRTLSEIEKERRRDPRP